VKEEIVEGIYGEQLIANDTMVLYRIRETLIYVFCRGDWDKNAVAELIGYFDEYDKTQPPPRLLIDVRQMGASSLDVRFTVARFVKERRKLGYVVVSVLQNPTHLFIYKAMARITGSKNQPYTMAVDALDFLKSSLSVSKSAWSAHLFRWVFVALLLSSRMSILMLKTTELSKVTAKAFFDEAVPKAIEHQEELAQKLGGRFSFSLFGDEGGSWVVDFGAAKVSPGIEGKVDLHLEMNTEHFDELLKGTLDVEKAAHDGQVRIRGDLAKLESIAILFDVPEA